MEGKPMRPGGSDAPAPYPVFGEEYMDLHHVTLTGPLELYRQGWQHEDELGRPGTAHQATGARATGDTCLMVFGIDPGLTGAIAVLAPDGTLQALWDTPTLTLKTSRGTRQEYDLPGLVGLLVRYTGSQTHVLIEEAQAMPGQGTRSMFTIGLGMGIWLGILGALGLAHTRVRPAVWKRRLGLTSDKEQARLRAQQLYPGADLRRKRDHGRAEALLLAWHGRQTYQERMP